MNAVKFLEISKEVEPSIRKQLIKEYCGFFVQKQTEEEYFRAQSILYIQYACELNSCCISKEFLDFFCEQILEISENSTTSSLSVQSIISKIDTEYNLDLNSKNNIIKRLVEIQRSKEAWVGCIYFLEPLIKTACAKALFDITAKEYKNVKKFGDTATTVKLLLDAAVCHLKLCDVDSAESSFGMATKFLKRVGNPPTLLFKYKYTQACILDSKKEYRSSYQSFFEAALATETPLDPSIDVYEHGIKNLILSEPSSYKKYLLKRVANSNFLSQLDLQEIALKILNDHLITFEQMQRESDSKFNVYEASTSDLYSKLSRFCILPASAREKNRNVADELNKLFCKHNIWCLSFVFSNIPIGMLADIVKVDYEFASNSLVELANDKAYEFYIDQVLNVVIFPEGGLSGIKKDSEDKNDDQQKPESSKKKSFADLFPENSTSNIHSKIPNKNSNVTENGLLEIKDVALSVSHMDSEVKKLLESINGLQYQLS
ncbi:hypothetical protein BB560_004399 [Smittium megazygosporum]|uniref:PCI domain-containing protein n=1 Tax=Smittium megazygosporum TaxID=133381 RepID=A0A2T9Z9F8_9FUNG|nr:hypothetical protein BB560_004399 [Smittium megazygosporum]